MIRVKAMAVLGDSIAVGLFRDLKLGQSLDLNHPLANRLLSGRGSFESLLREMDQYYQDQGLKLPNAFSTITNSCVSHACKLAVPGNKIQKLARSGSRVKDLVAQMDQMTGTPEYVVVSAGGNDFCSDGYSLEGLRRDFTVFVQKVKSLNGSKVLTRMM